MTTPSLPTTEIQASRRPAEAIHASHPAPGRFVRSLRFTLGRLLCLAAIALVLNSNAIGFAAEKIAIFGDALVRTPEFTGELRGAGFEVITLDSDGLMHLPEGEARLVVVAADAICPPESRAAFARFLADRRHVILVGAGNFDYAPQPVRGVPAVDLADASTYQVLQPAVRTTNVNWTVEPARVAATTTRDGSPALRFRTYLRGMGDVALQFSAASARATNRTVLTFWAQGDSYADLLAIEIVDATGGKWLGFVPLAGEWRHYAISLADFLPRGWKRSSLPAPLLDPAQVSTISLGMNAATIWREKPMSFALGVIELAEEASGRFVPTSALTTLRIPFEANKTTVPSGLFNPFHGARQLSTSSPALVRPSLGATSGPVNVAWNCPPPEVLDPSVKMGSDHETKVYAQAEREQRRIPLWRRRDPASGDDGMVAELRVLAGGTNAGASLALFGVTPAELARDPALRASLVESAAWMLRQPRIAAATINTTARTATHAAAPVLRVQAHNPLDRPVQGRVAVSIAGGRVRGEGAITLPRYGVAEVVVRLDAVPANFPFQTFNWEVTLESEAGRDVLADMVDTERALLYALAHLVRTQRQFPDGRISHHYFGDAYGVRALFPYLDLVQRQPERLQRNRDLWVANPPEVIRDCGLRFVDMLLDRQNEEGSIPMGYGEDAFSYNVADGGSIALALGQIAPLLDDDRREACWQFCRRFAMWAERYYISETSTPKTKSDTAPSEPPARAGYYGLGSVRGARKAGAPYWVLPDILAVQMLLPYVDSSPDWRFVADRNLRFYLDAGHSSRGYFHAEAFIWSWLDTPDAALRQRLAENLTRTFVPDFLEGREDDMFEVGARRTLRALPLIYYRRYIADDPEVRAALLKYVWTFGAETSERWCAGSRRRIPNPITANPSRLQNTPLSARSGPPN